MTYSDLFCGEDELRVRATNLPQTFPDGIKFDDGTPIATSFPIFEPLMATLGASLVRGQGQAA